MKSIYHAHGEERKKIYHARGEESKKEIIHGKIISWLLMRGKYLVEGFLMKIGRAVPKIHRLNFFGRLCGRPKILTTVFTVKNHHKNKKIKKNNNYDSLGQRFSRYCNPNLIVMAV